MARGERRRTDGQERGEKGGECWITPTLCPSFSTIILKFFHFFLLVFVFHPSVFVALWGYPLSYNAAFLQYAYERYCPMALTLAPSFLITNQLVLVFGRLGPWSLNKETKRCPYTDIQFLFYSARTWQRSSREWASSLGSICVWNMIMLNASIFWKNWVHWPIHRLTHESTETEHLQWMEVTGTVLIVEKVVDYYLATADSELGKIRKHCPLHYMKWKFAFGILATLCKADTKEQLKCIKCMRHFQQQQCSWAEGGGLFYYVSLEWPQQRAQMTSCTHPSR